MQRRILEELGADITWSSDPRNPTPTYHPMGPTRMGANPEESVVDRRLRTHDLANITVASSSVFRTGGALRLTHTIAALSLKAADHVHTGL